MRKTIGLCRALHDGKRGVAALEFALIAPVMIVLLLATIELTNIVRVQAKLNVAAGQLAELVAGQPSVIIGTPGSSAETASSLSDLCAGAAMNMLPYNTGVLQASIGSVTVAWGLGFVHPTTDWTTDVSCGSTSYHAGQSLLYNLANTPRSLFTQDGSPYNFNGGGGTPVYGYSAISVQLRYQYANVLPFTKAASILLVATAVARPRSNATVSCTTNANTSSPTACPQNP